MPAEKKIYIRPEDVAELIYDLAGKCNDIEKLKEQIKRIIWYLKNEKFDRLQEEFKIELAA